MATIDGTAGAFVVGLVTSLHCAGMCGPLACTWALGFAASKTVSRDALLYHGARLAAYTSLGTFAGAVASLPLRWFHHGVGVIFPWMLVLAFLGVALGLDRWIPKPLFLSRPMARLRGAVLRVPAGARAALLGAATPLLPCGPLYLMLGLAMANGSAIGGAQFAFAFGLGTVPLLWFVQTQIRLLHFRLSSKSTFWLLRGLALGAAFVMAWRLRGTVTGGSEIVSCH